MPKWRGLWAVLVVLLVASASTAAHASAARGTKPKKACDLLKRSEIERVLGLPAGKPELGTDLCYWPLGDPAAGGDQLSMTLLVDRGRKAKSNYEKGRNALRPDVLVDIDGLGKDAYFAISNLSVLKNKTTALYMAGVADQSQAEELARIAVQRA
jgi:hypothetical protein